VIGGALRRAALASAVLVAGAAATGAGATTAQSAPDLRPALGRHVAELCVATSAAPPSCGPAQADVRPKGEMTVRVDDVVYHLKLHSSEIEIVVMHNVVQIDEMVLPYEWSGGTLKFTDSDRSSRYEIRFPPEGVQKP
jgi:hypothetical protein